MADSANATYFDEQAMENTNPFGVTKESDDVTHSNPFTPPDTAVNGMEPKPAPELSDFDPFSSNMDTNVGNDESSPSNVTDPFNLGNTVPMDTTKPGLDDSEFASTHIVDSQFGGFDFKNGGQNGGNTEADSVSNNPFVNNTSDNSVALSSHMDTAIDDQNQTDTQKLDNQIDMDNLNDDMLLGNDPHGTSPIVDLQTSNPMTDSMYDGKIDTENDPEQNTPETRELEVETPESIPERADEEPEQVVPDEHTIENQPPQDPMCTSLYDEQIGEPVEAPESHTEQKGEPVEAPESHTEQIGEPVEAPESHTEMPASPNVVEENMVGLSQNVPECAPAHEAYPIESNTSPNIIDLEAECDDKSASSMELPPTKSDPMTDSMYGDFGGHLASDESKVPVKSVEAWDNGFDDSEEQDTLKADVIADSALTPPSNPTQDVAEDGCYGHDEIEIVGKEVDTPEPVAKEEEEDPYFENVAREKEHEVVAVEPSYDTVAMDTHTDQCATRETDLDAMVTINTEEPDEQSAPILSPEPVKQETEQITPFQDDVTSDVRKDLVVEDIEKPVQSQPAELEPQIPEGFTTENKIEDAKVEVAEKTESVTEKKDTEKKPIPKAKPAPKKLPEALKTSELPKRGNDVKGKSTSARLSSKAKTNLSAESPRDKSAPRSTVKTTPKTAMLRNSGSDIKKAPVMKPTAPLTRAPAAQPTRVPTAPPSRVPAAPPSRVPAAPPSRVPAAPPSRVPARKPPVPRAPVAAKPSTLKTERALPTPRQSTTVTKKPTVTKTTSPVKPTSTPQRTPPKPGAPSSPRAPGSAGGSSSGGTPRAVKSKIGSLDNAKHSPGGGKAKVTTVKTDYKNVSSKCGSMQNANHKPKGGDKKVEQQKLEWKTQSKVGSLDNAKHKPKGGDKKIEERKLDWKVSSKVGSLDNARHKAGGGAKKIETKKLDFKDKAESKVGSMDNATHKPGGGDKKVETHKVEIQAQSKIGSLENATHQPGGGDKQIETHNLTFSENAKSRIDHGHANSSECEPEVQENGTSSEVNNTSPDVASSTDQPVVATE